MSKQQLLEEFITGLKQSGERLLPAEVLRLQLQVALLRQQLLLLKLVLLERL